MLRRWNETMSLQIYGSNIVSNEPTLYWRVNKPWKQPEWDKPLWITLRCYRPGVVYLRLQSSALTVDPKVCIQTHRVTEPNPAGAIGGALPKFRPTTRFEFKPTHQVPSPKATAISMEVFGPNLVRVQVILEMTYQLEQLEKGANGGEFKLARRVGKTCSWYSTKAGTPHLVTAPAAQVCCPNTDQRWFNYIDEISVHTR